jgi:hypothetical protein
MIFVSDPHFLRTNPLWLVILPTLAFAYPLLHVTYLGNFFTLPVIGAFSATSREGLMLCLRSSSGLVEHSRISTVRQPDCFTARLGKPQPCRPAIFSPPNLGFLSYHML